MRNVIGILLMVVSVCFAIIGFDFVVVDVMLQSSEDATTAGNYLFISLIFGLFAMFMVEDNLS